MVCYMQFATCSLLHAVCYMQFGTAVWYCSLLHAVCYMQLGTDLSWLRLMEDFGLFLFLSELALSCMEAEGREVEGGGWRGEGGSVERIHESQVYSHKDTHCTYRVHP